MIIDLKNCVITIEDGTSPTPKSVEVKMKDGTLSWTETYNREYILEKGVLDTVRNGDQAPMDVSIDGMFEYFSSPVGSATPTPQEALKQTGEADDWVSADTGDSCAPYAVNIKVVHTPTCAATDSIETFLFPKFRIESLAGDFKDGSLKFSGKCNVQAPTSVRSTPTP